VTFIRSTLFALWFFVVSAVIHIALLPTLLLPRRHAVAVSKFWVRTIFFGVKWIAGIRFEVRGQEFIPDGAALIAAKHQSAWETLAFTALLRDPAIVLKRELVWIPLFGWYITKIGTIPIDRASGGAAIRKMVKAAQRAIADNRQVMIFPEGTRRKPGAPPEYKIGVASLYSQLKVPCVPVALNSGLHWQGFWKVPGTIVVEFLPPIRPGLKRDAFMTRLEGAIETASNRLS